MPANSLLFSFQLSTRLFSLRPSGIAAEQNSNCACSLLSLFSVPPQHFLESLSDSRGIHPAYVQPCSQRWVFAANKTEVAPLREDLTEVNKERKKRTHSNCDTGGEEKELGASACRPCSLVQ